MAKEGNGYIVMPPRENSLFKSEGVEVPTLDSFGVEKSEKLDVVGGYLAELNPAQVRDMKRQGYQIFKDEVKSYIPNQEKLDMNALAEDAIAKAEAAIEKGELPEASDTSEKSRSLFVPRNEMTEPRFESTIQNAFRGQGVTIAVLDSGVGAHPDLGDRLIGQIDFVQGEQGARARPLLVVEGRHVMAGHAGGLQPIHPNEFYMQNWTLIGCCMGAGYGERLMEVEQEAHDAILELVRRGAYRPCVGRVIEFDEIPSALRDLVERRVQGRIVARIG